MEMGVQHEGINDQTGNLSFDTVRAFAEEFQIGEGDLVVTNEYIYKPFLVNGI